MTDEEAERAYDEAPAVPLSEERIREIVAYATGKPQGWEVVARRLQQSLEEVVGCIRLPLAGTRVPKMDLAKLRAALRGATAALYMARKFSRCRTCGGTGVMLGDPDAPARSIRRVDVPCPECQEQ
jgi:hypothetical protein